MERKLFFRNSHLHIESFSDITPGATGVFFMLSENYPKTRSSCPKVFCKKGVLNNFTKFTGKHLCQNLFFNKVAGWRVFSCEFFEISKNTFSYRTPPLMVTSEENVQKVINSDYILHNLWLVVILNSKWAVELFCIPPQRFFTQGVTSHVLYFLFV